MVKKYVLEHFGCKYCGSPDVVRYGTENGTQYWLCKKCRHKFADNRASPEMKTPPKQIASAVNMYYEGMSLNAIRRHLDQQFNNMPSNSTVYEWIDRYTAEAVKKFRQYPEGKHLIGVEEFAAPARFFSPSEWEYLRNEFATRIVEQWGEYAPNMTSDNVIASRVVTPYDIQSRHINMPQGSIAVGDMLLSQQDRFRPTPELSN